MQLAGKNIASSHANHPTKIRVLMSNRFRVGASRWQHSCAGSCVMSIRHGFPTRQSASDAARPQNTCTNIFARPMTPLTPDWPESVSAWFDAHDHIVQVSDMWDPFVDRAAMGNLKRRTVIGQPVGHFLADPTVRSTFRALFHNIRQSGQAAYIRARCDAPAGPARAMQLDFVAYPDGAIRAAWRFVHGGAAHLIPARRRVRFVPHELIRACGWCWRIHLGAGWHRIEQVAVDIGLLDRTPLPLMTHGICPRCSAALRAECLHAVAE